MLDLFSVFVAFITLLVALLGYAFKFYGDHRAVETRVSILEEDKKTNNETIKDVFNELKELRKEIHTLNR